MNPPLPALIADIDAIVRTRPAADQPAAIAVRLSSALADPQLLEPRHLVASVDHYRTNVVHVARDGSFSVVALVWLPGQRTPIHSHRSWCVVGVHQGVELEQSYRARSSAPELVPTSTQVLPTGHVTWLDAVDEIHDVTNVAAGLSVSIHIYGLDYRRYGSSVLEVFEADMVRRHRAPAA